MFRSSWQKRVQIFYLYLIVLLLLNVLTACTTAKLSDQITPGYIPESRESLLKWHDQTYKTYYGITGPVKSLTIFPDIINGKKEGRTWQFSFDKLGRLQRKFLLFDESQTQTTVNFDLHGNLQKIVTRIKGVEWRVTRFHYNADNLLTNIQYIDNNNGQIFEQVVSRQRIEQGWFDITKAVNSYNGPSYRQYSNSDELVWSSNIRTKQPGQRYFMNIADRVTSAMVEAPFTNKMTAVAGYWYDYDTMGNLKSISSYNSNDNGLYHITEFQYDDQNLLLLEKKQVIGNSVFNDAIDTNIRYRYDEIDNTGNWLERVVTITTKNERQTIVQNRKIIYFEK